MTRLDLRVGDVVELTARVTVETAPATGDWVVVGDNGFAVAWQVGDHRVKVKPVKLVSRRPKVGDVITGEELKARKWKRGTIIRDTDGSFDTYILLGDGLWHWIEGDEGAWPTTFSEFSDDEEIEIVRLPD